jgi:hypothetical protein
MRVLYEVTSGFFYGIIQKGTRFILKFERESLERGGWGFIFPSGFPSIRGL